MTSRERLLTALDNKRPDRLPCQVHGWMDYYLKHYLGGADWYEANQRLGFDYAIYVSPEYQYAAEDLANWEIQGRELESDSEGVRSWDETIVTPEGELHQVLSQNAFTTWNVEHLIKTDSDFELWSKYFPVPVSAGLNGIKAAREKLGDLGIVRSHPFSPGQGSPWQSFCCLYGTQEAILLGMDAPRTLHFMLDDILEKTLTVTRLWEGTAADMVEVGGGAGSSTVISPDFYREFGLPYDIKQNKQFHELGLKVVNHFCGGVMPMLDIVLKSGADGLETMTPPALGGDCDLAAASAQVGDKLFFIGGFDQNAGFERGNPALVRQMVFDCFEATKDHAGYIIAPSDHFFFGAPENLEAFTNACKECVY
jgi:uroporphyrinogen-III decarboxylase